MLCFVPNEGNRMFKHKIVRKYRTYLGKQRVPQESSGREAQKGRPDYRRL